MPVLPGAEPFSSDGGRIGALLVHGFTGCPQSMRPWAEHLAAAGLTVRLPRLPGHGTTWRELNLTRWPDWYGEAERAYDLLRGRCDTVFVMGLSMGGTLSLRLAEERADDVAGLVLVNPSLLSENRAARLLPLLQWLVPSVTGVGNDVAAAGVTELAYDRTPLTAAASLSRLWAATTADLGTVVAPILLFRSAVDHVVEPASARLLRAQVSSPQVEEVVLENSYHVATIDNDRQRIFDGSLDFVRQHAGAPL
jgi:carboxylesterase